MQLTESSIYINLKRLRSLLTSLNSYLGICKGVNGYRQALSIVRELSSELNKYVEFDRHRCCLVARDSNRNRIIKKFNLK